MKGSSQYSRPTTAKKLLPSPKIQKKTETQAIKTEQAESNGANLHQMIEESIARQKDCEARGKYVQAEGFKRRVKALKEQLQDREMDDIRIRHEQELLQLQEAHHAELNLFGLEWDKRIREFNQEIEKSMQELSERHEKQIREAENEMDGEKRFHQSPKLLELRKIEQELGKQQNYMEAHKVQIKANKLEKEEQEKHRRTNNQKSKSSINQLKIKQDNELEALKMRIRLQVQERERQRLTEQSKLRQKYENILKETEFQQNQELIRLNKAVRLNQLQKRSKAGLFSSSKDFGS